jgi:DNA-binding MarR family transcriptional regulator
MSAQNIEEHIGYHIRRAHSRFAKVFQEYSKQYGLKSQQITMLTSIRDTPGIGPAVVADRHSIERSHVTMLIGDLVKRGLVVKHDVRADGRKKGLFLTKTGEVFVAEIMEKLYHDMEPKLHGVLNSDEKTQLVSLLRKIYLV